MARRLVVTLTSCLPIFILTLWLFINAGGYGNSVDYGRLTPDLGNISQLIVWPISGGVTTLPSVGAVAAILLILALDSREGRQYLVSGTIPLLVIYLVSLGQRDFWFGRFFWLFVPFFVVAAAIWFRSASNLRLTGTLLLILALCIPPFQESVAPWSRGYDYRQGMQILDSHFKSGDSILVSNVIDEWAIERYGGRSTYPLVRSDTDEVAGLWSFQDHPSCLSPQKWEVSPTADVWRCPSSSSGQ